MLQLQSESIDQLAAALVAAQAEIHDVVKSSTNTFLNTKYADLSAVRSAVVGPFAARGLAVIQTFVPHAGDPIQFETVKAKKDRECRVPTQVLGYLRTQLVHTSGQWIASELPIAAAWGDSQTLGAAITYFRRYALAAIAGLAQEDDDGETAKGGYDRYDGRQARTQGPVQVRQTYDRNPSHGPAERPHQPTAAAPAPKPSRPRTGPELLDYCGTCKIDSTLKGWIVGNICKLGDYPANVGEWTPEQVTEAWPLIRRHLEKVKLTQEITRGNGANGNGKH